MAEFQVTASKLKEKAELLQQLNAGYEKKVQELILAQRQLNASWDGAGKEAFDRVFQEDCVKMDLFRQTVDAYYQALLQIIAGYEQAENHNISLIASGR